MFSLGAALQRLNIFAVCFEGEHSTPTRGNHCLVCGPRCDTADPYIWVHIRVSVHIFIDADVKVDVDIDTHVGLEEM